MEGLGFRGMVQAGIEKEDTLISARATPTRFCSTLARDDTSFLPLG